MQNRKIIKVTKTEFYTEDGKSHPMIFELDEIPSIKEFQKIYDQWTEIFKQQSLLESNESKIT